MPSATVPTCPPRKPAAWRIKRRTYWLIIWPSRSPEGGGPLISGSTLYDCSLSARVAPLLTAQFIPQAGRLSASRNLEPGDPPGSFIGLRSASKNGGSGVIFDQSLNSIAGRGEEEKRSQGLNKRLGTKVYIIYLIRRYARCLIFPPVGQRASIPAR